MYSNKLDESTESIVEVEVKVIGDENDDHRWNRGNE